MAVLLVLAFVLVWSIPGARAEERLRVALDVRNSVVTPPKVLALALREASSIWSPYGVTVDRVTGGRGHGGHAIVVPVTLQSARARGQLMVRRSPLGWTGFLADGQPIMRIAIFYDVVALAARDGVLFGPRDLHATILQERILARVLGRTIAHELGHVVLRSSDHSAAGLMRAGQSVAELQHPSQDGFVLDGADVARLRQVRDERTRAVAAAQ
jgi:hypothetical protein